MSIADQVFAADDITREPLEVPEWSVTFELRAPDGVGRANLGRLFNDVNEDAAQAYAALIIACAFDPETGERVFPLDTPLTALTAKNGMVLERVGQACLKVAGMDEDAESRAGKDS